MPPAAAACCSDIPVPPPQSIPAPGRLHWHQRTQPITPVVITPMRVSNVGSKNEVNRGKGFKSKLTCKRSTATATATAVPSLPWPPPLLTAQATEPALLISPPQSPCDTAIDTSEGRMRTSVKCRARHRPPLRPLTMQLPFAAADDAATVTSSPWPPPLPLSKFALLFPSHPGSRRGRKHSSQPVLFRRPLADGTTQATAPAVFRNRRCPIPAQATAGAAGARLDDSANGTEIRLVSITPGQ